MAIKRLQNNADYYYDRAESYLNSGDYENAVDFFYRSLMQEPFNPWTMATIGDCYMEMGLTSRALSWYYRAISIEKDCDTAFLGIINAMLASNRLNDVAYYLKMLANTPIFEKIMEEFDVDVIYSDKPENVSLERKAQFSLTKSTKNKRYLMEGKRCLINGKITEAVENFDKIDVDGTEYSEATHFSALIKLDEGDYEKALDYSDRLLKIDPNSAKALVINAMVYQRLNQAEKLQDAIAKLIKVESDDIFEVMSIAVCLSDMGRFEEAEKFYYTASNFSPFSKDTLIPLAQCYHNNKKHDLSHLVTVKLCKIYPDYYGCSWLSTYLSSNKEQLVGVGIDLPYEKFSQDLPNQIREIFGSNKSVRGLEKAILDNPENLEKVYMLYASNHFETISYTAEKFALSGKLCQFLRLILVRNDVPFALKQGCLSLLLATEKRHDFVLCVGDVLRLFKPRIPRVTDDYYLNCAYWKAYATVAMLGVGCEKNLFSVFKNFCADIKDKSIPTECISAISAILSILAFKNKFEKTEFAGEKLVDFCELFGAESDRCMQILTLLGEKL